MIDYDLVIHLKGAPVKLTVLTPHHDALCTANCSGWADVYSKKGRGRKNSTLMIFSREASGIPRREKKHESLYLLDMTVD